MHACTPPAHLSPHPPPTPLPTPTPCGKCFVQPVSINTKPNIYECKPVSTNTYPVSASINPYLLILTSIHEYTQISTSPHPTPHTHPMWQMLRPASIYYYKTSIYEYKPVSSNTAPVSTSTRQYLLIQASIYEYTPASTSTRQYLGVHANIYEYKASI